MNIEEKKKNEIFFKFSDVLNHFSSRKYKPKSRMIQDKNKEIDFCFFLRKLI